jgi:YesN/AraC family two-component response regulator
MKGFSMNQLLRYEKLMNLHVAYKHPSYYLERKLLSEIKRCLDQEAIHTLDQINSLERAHLANDPIRSLKNSMLGSCVLFSRAAIEMNADPEDAFSLSDIFILKIESLRKIDDLREFEYQMMHEFIRLIRTARTARYSLPVTQVIQYIHSHITESLSLQILSHYTQKTKEYLSTIFKEEVGSGIVDFIQKERISEAKNYLEFTDLMISEIAILMNFSSQSYFTKTFRKHEFCTPSQYRRDRSILSIDRE